jgi:UDP-3-O-[3-hydroxymyristoyl] glucosamine N-acyltransferase
VVAVENPVAAFASVLNLVARERNVSHAAGIHPTAVISKTARIGKSAKIGPLCVVEDGAEIADGAVLIANVYVGPRVRVGKETIIYPQVVLREDTEIGARCIVHGGAVIGSDGFGYFFASGRHNKIPQVGNVVIEDDVEIGSCSTIDRATTGSTIVRKGAKIDNLVQVAHNVEVGAHSLLIAQVGIAGSSKLGPGVVLAGQVGVADHVNIGAGAQVGAQSGLKDDVEPGAVLFGSPAQPIADTIRQTLLIRRLPELFKDVKKLKESDSRHD